MELFLGQFPKIIDAAGPWGIAGFTVAVLALIILPFRRPDWLAALAVVIIAGLFTMQMYFSTRPLTNIAPKEAASPVNPEASTVAWVDTGTFADWGGGDYAYTRGEVPAYSLNNTTLCNQSNIGFVAVCWSDRPEGYPPNVATMRNFLPPPAEPKWCTYKTKDISITTAATGRAVKGRVYLCAALLKP